MSRQSKDSPPGFTFLKPDSDSFYGSSGTTRQGLFLPTQVHSTFVAEWEAAAEAALKAEADQRAADRAAELNANVRGPDSTKAVPVSVADAIKNDLNAPAIGQQSNLFRNIFLAVKNDMIRASLAR